ncbi:type II toxin-antitoxin system Phd/YefM family antitoxin [Adlercreutzia sp. ZJ242]|uniref:type II toxin-antitoxin system Phd/YefM family antitoxin n=1 Tax=Adlercreutzia sp. ZJ242 TaxID=2709409 RepID=UPI0013ECCA23|nr:type II toxin-antitoxin system Phd/YefM family antitoxin [Adlercreutzia sp. ZJ242]
MVAVIEGKVAFGRDQVVTSTQASKNFGEMRRRAKSSPLFVSDRNDGIDTVIVGFDDFERMAVELERLREERLYAIAAMRLAEGDADPDHRGIPVEEVIGDDEFAKLVEDEVTDPIPDSELFA